MGKRLAQHHLAALDQYENEKIKPGMRVFVRIKASEFGTTEIQTQLEATFSKLLLGSHW